MDLEQRIAQLSPAKLALLELKLQKNKPPEHQPKPRASDAPRQKYAPLSFAQERLWFLEQMEPDRCIYNLPAVMPLHGPVDPSRVEASVRRIVARHSALRTRFVVKDDNPYQVIVDDVGEALDYSVADFRNAPAQPTAAQVSQAVNDAIWVPFNLATGPLVRVRLILQRNNENVLVVVMHHIASDGWSIDLFTNEFRILYESTYSGDESALHPSPPQYVDYAIEQRQSLAGDKLESLLAYWRTRLDGAPAVIGLPLDHPRPARQSFKGALHAFSVPQSLLPDLKSLCRECGVVPFMVLLSAFKVLLFRYTNQSKIVVGTPIANRAHSDLEAVIGFFTNTLALASSVAPEMTFRELLAGVRDTTLEAYDHQELPFEKLVSELQPERSLSHNPLFQVMFTFQNLRKGAVGEEAQPSPPPDEGLSLDVKFSKFDLTLAISEGDDALSAVFEYATDLFDRDTVERMAGHYVAILEHVLRNPDARLAGFSFLPPAERRLILEQWNDTARTWPEFAPLHVRFERWARRTPAATAVLFDDTALTYEELDRRADRIASLLRSKGVERGSIVAICLPRSLEMVCGLLGILKAGAAYMPVEPDFPAGRIAYMLGDAQVRHALTIAECVPVLAKHDIDTIVLDELDAGGDGERAVSVSLSASDLAYVIYTSGSTGQPKGVMVSHGAIDNRLQWMQAQYGLQPTDRVMQKTPFTFDVSVWEFFWTLSEGACLVVAEPERHKEPVYLVDLIRKHRVTCLHFVPSMLQLMLPEDLARCDSLTRIICSGEALTVEQCRRLQALPGVRGHNLYGPTEAAVDVTHWDCDEWRDQYLSVPIGRPIANTQIYILNEALQPAPIGVPGELYIGGHNLAQGYVNKPELTAKQFVADPFADEPGARLYKTGDLARFRSDGAIEYIGRIDSQVKLRGLRIELGEIEFLLRQHPGIAEAVVVVTRFGDQDDRLAAYVVPENPDAPVDAGALRAFIAKNLPHYMVPPTITTIPELPLSANGKLDRKSLPQPASRVTEPMEPVSDIERELAAIWQRILKIDSVKSTDDFFALGGHSILVTHVINSINGHYHLNVPVRLLFENPTIRTLAKALSEFEDETWLDESKTANTILMRSNRRLLQVLDELSEEQIDDFLEDHAEDGALARFDDVGSLRRWAQNYVSPSEAKPKAVPTANGVRASASLESLTSAYVRHYMPLARTSAALESIAGRRYNSPPSARPDLNGSGDLVARLRDEAGRIFESYAREMTQRLSENGHGTMAPGDVQTYCAQLMSMAGLAASIERFPDPRGRLAETR